MSKTQVRLHRAFVRAIRNSPLKQARLAQLGEYASHTQLSKQLRSKFTVTPLVLKRLCVLAEAVGHTGDMFEVVRRG